MRCLISPKSDSLRYAWHWVPYEHVHLLGIVACHTERLHSPNTSGAHCECYNCCQTPPGPPLLLWICPVWQCKLQGSTQMSLAALRLLPCGLVLPEKRRAPGIQWRINLGHNQ